MYEADDVPTVTAGDAEIPRLGVGTFQLSPEEAERAVGQALDLGYRHVDTAQLYDNEDAVGRAIAASSVDREDVFATTKLWRSNLRREDVRPSLETSLDRLGTETVDLLLVHWPHPRVPVRETLAAMAEARDDGLVEHVGVSNFTRDGLVEALGVAVDLGLELVTDQVQYHPFVDQSDLLEFCADQGLALTAYSPLARGRMLGDEALERIGERYGKSAAQVALRWLVQQEQVVAIPRSSSREHLAQNRDVFDFELSEDEVARIDAIEPGLRMRAINALPALMRRNPL